MECVTTFLLHVSTHKQHILLGAPHFILICLILPAVGPVLHKRSSDCLPEPRHAQMAPPNLQNGSFVNSKTGDSDNAPLSIAIIGGGIAGLVLTIALLKHAPHFSITLYESASSFGEIGAGVGFQPNFVQTMNLIDPSIRTAFANCSRGNPETNRWFTIRVGDQKKIIGDKEDGVVYRNEEGEEVKLDDELFVVRQRPGLGRGIHRAHFLDELVKLVPEGIAKFQKRLVDVQRPDDGSSDAILSFADGSTARHSAVLGCDGIKSKTRQIVLEDFKTAKAVFTGKYAYRGLIPMQKAVEALGEERTSTSQMYVGQGGHVLTFPIANGTILNGMFANFGSRGLFVDSDSRRFRFTANMGGSQLGCQGLQRRYASRLQGLESSSTSYCVEHAVIGCMGIVQSFACAYVLHQQSACLSCWRCRSRFKPPPRLRSGYVHRRCVHHERSACEVPLDHRHAESLRRIR